MLLDKKRMTMGIDIQTLDWINIISELVYMVYGYNLIIITDYDNNLKLRMINTTQVCLFNKDCNAKYLIICAHDDGIYPLIELEHKEPTSKIKTQIFSKDNDLIIALTGIIEKEISNVKFLGTTLLDIITFVTTVKKYKIMYLLRGKRGLIYAVILSPIGKSDEIYVPCIYSEYLDSRYKTIDVFPNIKKFKRKNLYNYIDNYNCYLIKKNKDKTKVLTINPYAVVKHNEDYIGFKVKYLNNKFGTTFYHSPEKTIGRYSVNVINIPYSIVDINNALSQQSEHTVHPNVGQYAYYNYSYSLFLIEFAYEVRKHKNKKVFT